MASAPKWLISRTCVVFRWRGWPSRPRTQAEGLAGGKAEAEDTGRPVPFRVRRPDVPSGGASAWNQPSKRVTLREPGVAGSYEVVECPSDGSLLLRPQPERLSDVVRETVGQVFRDEEFAAHLERVAASEDDLPADPSA